jgi:hypothetical protein
MKGRAMKRRVFTTLLDSAAAAGILIASISRSPGRVCGLTLRDIFEK